MPKRDIVYPVVLLIALSILIAHYAFDGLKTWLQILGFCGTLLAITVALFKEIIVSKLNPYQADLHVVRNLGLYEPETGDIVWHLRVTNRSKGKPLLGCRVT